MTWLVVGLGNPGREYAGNRHNIGFMVVDELVRRAGCDWREKFNGRFTKARFGDEDVILLEPLTFMNRSGTSVGAAGAFFKVPQDRAVVVHDELDLAFGQVRVKVGGGHAGHNGLRSIFSHFGKEFVRVRVGIGRPAHGDVSGWVLSDFSKDEAPVVPRLVDAAADAVDRVVREGPGPVMNAYNGTSSVV
ncbi:MAG: aminoacyl-tRNA hydrolase [Deltaproteobacteria bacterium]|nr:aminoacyl-tRNA hydrolase [Deltaproteobacteria bacterium]MCB9788067.1 aminoacyl-tRNA hydrolase [Deltaproteobacteria bacterium]